MKQQCKIFSWKPLFIVNPVLLPSFWLILLCLHNVSGMYCMFPLTSKFKHLYKFNLVCLLSEHFSVHAYIISWWICLLMCQSTVFVRGCVCVSPLSLHVSGMKNLFSSLWQNLPITSLRHLSSLPIHEFLSLPGRDWLLMNNWLQY